LVWSVFIQQILAPQSSQIALDILDEGGEEGTPRDGRGSWPEVWNDQYGLRPADNLPLGAVPAARNLFV
jgi:hypothetical protein